MATFALLGHGAVGSLFARLLTASGAQVVSHDVLLDDPARAAEVRARIQADGATLVPFAEAVRGAGCILAVTPTQACLTAAERATALLTPQQLYIDFASTSPGLKQQIGLTIAASGATFVEAAILGAVGASLNCPAILLGGPAAESASQMLNTHGLKTTAWSQEVGPASAFKMIRSVFSKGMEALLIETLVSARRAGLEREIWAEILNTLAPGRTERVLETWIRSHAVSSGRRWHEMQQVSGYLQELEVDPVVTAAVAEVFRRSNELGIASAFLSEPESTADVIEFLEQQITPQR